MRTLVLLASLLALVPASLAADALRGPAGLDLAAIPLGAPVAAGDASAGACRSPEVVGFLRPGSVVTLALSPECVVVRACPAEGCALPVVDALSCSRRPSGNCADVRPQSPTPPDAKAYLDCLPRDAACALPTVPDVSVQPEVGTPPLGAMCADYALHSIVDTGDTEVRNALVWEAGCGTDPQVFYGQGQCLVKGAGPQPGNWVQTGCPHLHDWSGYEVAHETTGHFQHVNSASSAVTGQHSNMAGVHGDAPGNAWCTYSLQFNPHSSFLTAICAGGPL